jgi:hypothetical protein
MGEFISQLIMDHPAIFDTLHNSTTANQKGQRRSASPF